MPPLPPDIIVQLIRDYLPAVVVFVLVWVVLPRAVEIVGQYNTHRMEFQTTTFQGKMDFADKLLESGEKEQERHLASEEAFRKTIDALTKEVRNLSQDVRELIALMKEQK